MYAGRLRTKQTSVRAVGVPIKEPKSNVPEHRETVCWELFLVGTAEQHAQVVVVCYVVVVDVVVVVAVVVAVVVFVGVVVVGVVVVFVVVVVVVVAAPSYLPPLAWFSRLGVPPPLLGFVH